MVNGLRSKRPPVSGSMLMTDDDFSFLKAELNVLMNLMSLLGGGNEGSLLLMANCSTKLKAEVIRQAGGWKEVVLNKLTQVLTVPDLEGIVGAESHWPPEGSGRVSQRR